MITTSARVTLYSGDGNNLSAILLAITRESYPTYDLKKKLRLLIRDTKFLGLFHDRHSLLGQTQGDTLEILCGAMKITLRCDEFVLQETCTDTTGFWWFLSMCYLVR